MGRSNPLHWESAASSASGRATASDQKADRESNSASHFLLARNRWGGFQATTRKSVSCPLMGPTLAAEGASDRRSLEASTRPLERTNAPCGTRKAGRSRVIGKLRGSISSYRSGVDTRTRMGLRAYRARRDYASLSRLAQNPESAHRLLKKRTEGAKLRERLITPVIEAMHDGSAILSRTVCLKILKARLPTDTGLCGQVWKRLSGELAVFSQCSSYLY
jgi:hypothetical protein